MPSRSVEQWFIVVGRKAYDDEDSCVPVFAKTLSKARQAFVQVLRDANDDQSLSTDTEDEYKQIYINYVVACGSREPEIVENCA